MALDGRRQLLHWTVLNAEGLSFDGAEYSGGLTQQTKFSPRILDKGVPLSGGFCVGVCGGLGILTVQLFTLQLIGQSVGFLTHSFHLITSQRTPADLRGAAAAALLNLRCYANRNASFLMTDRTNKHLIIIIVVVTFEAEEKRTSH